MNDVCIIAMPTLYILALITGFMLNTCSKTTRLEKLELENDYLARKLEEAEKALGKTVDSSSESTSS